MLDIDYPLPYSQTEGFHIPYAGQSFGFCLKGSTHGLSSNRASTYWKNKKNMRYYPLDITHNTSCITCQCLVNELMQNRITDERIETFVALYKSDPCLAEADILRSVLIIRDSGLGDSGFYTFTFRDLKLQQPKINDDYKLTVEGKVL